MGRREYLMEILWNVWKYFRIYGGFMECVETLLNIYGGILPIISNCFYLVY